MSSKYASVNYSSNGLRLRSYQKVRYKKIARTLRDLPRYQNTQRLSLKRSFNDDYAKWRSDCAAHAAMVFILNNKHKL